MSPSFSGLGAHLPSKSHSTTVIVQRERKWSVPRLSKLRQMCDRVFPESDETIDGDIAYGGSITCKNAHENDYLRELAELSLEFYNDHNAEQVKKSFKLLNVCKANRIGCFCYYGLTFRAKEVDSDDRLFRGIVCVFGGEEAVYCEIKEDDEIEIAEGEDWPLLWDHRIDVEFVRWLKELKINNIEVISHKLHNGLSPVRHQGYFGTCVFIAAISCLEMIHRSSGGKDFFDLSDLYNNVFKLSGNDEKFRDVNALSGAVVSDVFSYAQHHGCSFDSECRTVQARNTFCHFCKEAPRVKISSYRMLGHDDVLEITERYPVVAVVRVYSSFFNCREVFYRGPSNEEIASFPKDQNHLSPSYHALLVVGNVTLKLDGTTQAFLVLQNSYGTSFGFMGFCFVPFSAANTSFFKEFWMAEGPYEVGQIRLDSSGNNDEARVELFGRAMVQTEPPLSVFGSLPARQPSKPASVAMLEVVEDPVIPDLSVLCEMCDECFPGSYEIVEGSRVCGGSITYKNAHKEDYLREKAEIALKFYNDANSESFKLVKVCKANLVCSINFGLTFKAKEDGSDECFVFRAVVCILGGPEALFCEIMKDGDEIKLLPGDDDYVGSETPNFPRDDNGDDSEDVNALDLPWLKD